MTRQLDVKAEERETARRLELVRALEYKLVGALQNQGIELLGLAIRYEEFNSLLTLKAIVDEVRSVAFVGSDTMMNVILKATSQASRGTLKWRADKYHVDGA